MRRPASSCDKPRLRTALVISITRPDLIFSLFASGKPRSAKTLPELFSISTPSIIRFRIAHLLCNFLRDLQVRADDVKVWLRCLNAVPALFLEYLSLIHISAP